MPVTDDFSADFLTLTGEGKKPGYEPLHWQRRLFKLFCENEIPKICDLPTGMGKTSVIHLWLLALRHQIAENKPRLPTRLVYVVDRRTVVDQATKIAKEVQENLPALGLGEDWLSVSTLRGQLADNREWTTDPSRPAIIVGTVDMIGSRLLFSGYRSSFKLRPLDAGLLGQDTFLVLDEAHLSAPFAKLIRALSEEGAFQKDQGQPMRIMCMSATTTDDYTEAFRLEKTDLEGDRESNPILRRYEAAKRLIIEPPSDKKTVEDRIIKRASELAEDNSRVVVFVRSPDDATKIATALGKRKGGQPDNLAVLTGTIRGMERNKLLGKAVLKRFLDGDEKPEQKLEKGHAILVSTSAGEVGFDLNADHMVCDAAPIDSMIQRLGRVNRRGYGDAKVHVFVVQPSDKETKNDVKSRKNPKHTFESAVAAAVKCLEDLEEDGDGAHNASPKSLDELKKTLGKEQLNAASTPSPAMVELTDILLDAWSMTSITEERMPGRPPVAPWLRGIDDELPQTTVAWRAELDLLVGGDEDRDALEAIFEKHRIRPHETLTVRTDYIVDFLNRAVQASTSVGETRVLLAGRELALLSVNDLIGDDSLLGADPTLVLPASFGGLNEGGMLDAKSMVTEAGPESTEKPRHLDVADEPGYERGVDDPHRLRLLLEKAEDDWSVRAMPGAALPEAVQGLTAKLPELIGVVQNRLGLNVRLRQAVTTDEEREVSQYLLCLSPRFFRKPARAQALHEHVTAVEDCASRIAQETRLAEPFASALRLASKYHDEGKKTETWQNAVRNTDLTKPVGKSGGSMNVKRLGGYRHEFGPLLRIPDPPQPEADLPANPEALELMLHLIAAHHGNGRPHFKKPDDIDYYDRKRCPQVGVEIIRRFARLQRKYGYWHLAWLENLLRCADAMASAENDEEET